MTSSQSGPRVKLSTAVARHLRSRIRSGDLKPGDKLPSERQLMQDFDVGRPAVREALQQMQHLGLAEIRHGGRAVVVEPSLGQIVEQLGAAMHHLLTNSSASLENLKEARLMFEVGMVRIAAKRRSSADIARLRSILEAQRDASDDLERFIALDGEFHREIASLSGNPIFVSVSDAIFQWLAEFYRGAVSVPGLERLTIQEHEGVLASIEMGNADAAAKGMIDHLDRANELYRRAHFQGDAEGG